MDRFILHAIHSNTMKTKQLTKQELRIVLDAYIRDFLLQAGTDGITDEAHKIYIEIRNKLIKLAEVNA